MSAAARAGCEGAGQRGVGRGGRDEGAVELLQRIRPARELAQPVQRAAVRVHGAPGVATVIVIGENTSEAHQVVRMQMMFMKKPVLIMSVIFRVLLSYTMALGAVATGSMKA